MTRLRFEELRHRRAIGAILLVLTSACSGPSSVDAGVDGGQRDAGAPDGGMPDSGIDAGTDAGPPRMRPLELRWAQTIQSTETLAVIADARIARTPDDGVVVSVSLGGAPAMFSCGTVGDASTNRVTQALGWYDADGRCVAARAVAVADPVLDGFSASGFALDTMPDGTVLVGGRFLAGARFGGSDPAAVVYQTVREMPTRDLVVTSEDGYVARFDPTRQIEWARRAKSETGFAHLVVTDVAALADGSALVLGSYDDSVTLGEGETNETRFTLTPSAEREVFLARVGPDGTLAWARHTIGHSEPSRIVALADGSSVALVRYSADVTFGPGEAGERTIAGPPDGVLSGDAIVRFDADGRLVWVTPVQSDATTYPGLRDLSVMDDGSVITGGTFRGEVTWPDDPSIDPIRVYGVEGLIARVDPAGALVWQKRIRPVNTLQLQAITPVADGAWVAVSVSMHGAMFLPEGADALFLEPGSASNWLVLLRYDLDGVLRAAHLAGEDDVGADDLVTLGSGDVALVGRYGSSTVLEPHTSVSHRLPPANAFRNVFVTRYSPVL